MNKNLILFVTGLVVLCLIIGLLLFQKESTVEKDSKPLLVENNPQDIVESEKKINETPIKDKEVKKNNKEVVSNSKVEKEPHPQNIEKIENINTKSTEKEVIVKKPDAEIKKSKYSFLLEFKGIKESILPNEADVVLHPDKKNFGENKIVPLKKTQNEKFVLNLENKNSPNFDIRVKGFGYAKSIEIPYDKEKIIFIDLIAGSRISGIITESNNKPIAKVAVEILKELDTGYGMSLFLPITSPVYSDDLGKYLVSDIEPGRYKIKLNHDKYLPLEQWVSFPVNGDQAINFQMIQGAQIVGIVVDQNEVPIKEVTVKMNKSRSQDMFTMDLSNPEEKTAITDSNGQFIFYGISPSAFLFTVEAKGIGHLKDFKVELQKGELLKNIKLVLTTSFKIKGKVIDKSGKPIENIKLEISSEKMNFNMILGNQNVILTDKNGEFEKDFLDDKSYTITIESEIYRLTNSDDLKVKAGTIDLEITVKEMMEFRGVVLLPNGQNASDYELYLRYFEFEKPEPIKNVKISQNGFSFNSKILQFGNNASKIFIVVRLKGYDESVSKLIEVKSNADLLEDIVIQLKDASVTNFRISTFDKKPVRKIEYIASPVANRLNSRSTPETVKLDENSQFQILGLKEVEYDILFKLEGYASILIKFKRNANSEQQEIVFTKGSTIKGIVYDTNGQTAAFQKLNLKRSDFLSISLLPFLNYSNYTNDKGEFLFENIPIGEYRLKKVNPDKPFSPMDIFNITEGESIKIISDQDVVMNIGSKEEILLQITGQLFLDDKKYESGATIFLSGNSNLNLTSTKLNSTDQEGKFKINDVKSGKYNLVIGLGNLVSEEMERFSIEVIEGRENYFPINLYSEKLSGIVNSVDGEKLNGTVSVFSAGFLSSNFNSWEAYTKAIYSCTFKNGAFSVKIPKTEAVDIYFSFQNKKYSALYLLNVTRDELLKKNWIIEVPSNKTLELKVVDEAGNKITKYDVHICDDKGISLMSDITSAEGNWDNSKEEVYLPLNKDCTVYISSAEYSVGKQIVLKNSIEPINFILKTGFELTIIAKNFENNIVDLYDENKKRYIRPSSQNDMVMTHLGGGNAQVIKEGKKTIKNLLLGKYLVKLTDEKGEKEVWSELIEITDKNKEVEFK